MAENPDTPDKSTDELTDRQQQAREAIEAELPDFVLNTPFDDISRGHSDASAHGPCHRCERQNAPLTELSVDEKQRYVCHSCADDILREVDDHYWYDRFRRSHYDIIAAFLDSFEEVWCVHDHAYEGGEMFIHTGHLTREVVSDALDFMGSIYSIHIERVDDSCWDCMDEHGDCIEIVIDFGNDSVPLRPLRPAQLAEALTTRSVYDVNYIDEADKLFDHDGRN